LRDAYYREGGYLAAHPTWDVEDSPWKAEQIMRLIRRNGLRPRTVCEVGCGAGGVLRALHDRLPDDVAFAGFDISPQAIALAAERATGRLRFEVRDVARDGAPGTYDLMLLVDVIEHVEDVFGFLRSLRPLAGHTIVLVPLDLSAQSVLREWPILLARAEDGHVHYFTKRTALETLRDAGYEIVDHVYARVAIERPWSLKSRLAAFPRRALHRLNADLAARALGGFSLVVLARPRA
jgi:SAM-dependent methyltransferase